MYRKQKNKRLHPYPRPPQTPDNMIEFNGLKSLEWTQICTADFWSVGLYCMNIEETMSGKLGWIEGNEDKAWFNALDRAALNLIQQYAVIGIDLTNMDIYSVSLRDILCTVQTFSFDDLLPTLRNRLAICQSAGDLFNTDLLVNIDTHANPSKPVILPFTSPSLSRDTTPTPTTRACNEFISTTENNEANYSAAALAEEKQLTADFAWETTELICHGEFAPRQFRFDTLRAPSLLAETANAIGRKYGRLHFRAKTKLHID